MNHRLNFRNNTFPLLILMIFIGFSHKIKGQVVFKGGTPPSFSISNKQPIPVENLPTLNYNKLAKEDKKRQEENRPFKFGHLHTVNLTLENSGTWTILPNGDRIWQLKIFAPKALSINLNYNRFVIPAGGELYIYNDSKANVLGPFTYRNQKDNLEFATGFTEGEYCALEYYEPAKYSGKGKIEISGVVHGYRSIRNHASNMLRNFQEAGPCNYDVGCTLGNGWKDQIKSVAMILTEDNTGGCTGTLINTTANDCIPYMITADHCFEQDNIGDQLNNIFLFNYDSPDPICPGISQTPGPIDQTVTGCTIISKSQYDPNDDEDFYVDFCLLRLDNNPADYYDVYYSGWDRRNIPSTVAVGIHHGNSDVKKICQDDDGTYSSANDVFWHVIWEFGTTESGASGSALFDQNSKRIIGQLSKGDAACNGNVSNNGEEDFGKIYWGWDMFSSEPTEQLKPWLDPINSGDLFIDGNDCSINLNAAFSPSNASNLIFCGSSTPLHFKDQSLGVPTSWSWTFSGADVSPSSSTEKNPTITVNGEGTLMVTLEVSNAQETDIVNHSYEVTFYDCSQDTYCSSPNVSIPDNDLDGVSNSINFPSNLNLMDLNVEVDINHEYIADLIIKLEHNGTEIRLLSRPNQPVSDCFEEDIVATFDDQASLEAHTMCNSTGEAISGFVIPYHALSVFNHVDPSGLWTLTVSDISGDDTGDLNSWCMHVSTLDNDCFSNLSHSNGLLQVENGVNDYESVNTIITTLPTTIQNGAIIDYDATDCILINPPFEVKLGAKFNVFIDGCNDGNGGDN